MRVGIVGGGIMGLAAAWALTKRGHEVTLFEQGPIPNPLGSSVDQHRLIRYPYGAMVGYARMVEAAYGAWDRLWADLGECHYVETGCLGLSYAAGDWADLACNTMARLGHAYRALTPEEAAADYPLIDMDGVASVFHTTHGGPLLAERIVAALADWLRANGADLREHTAVAELRPSRAEAVPEIGDAIAADVLVVAAGPWAARLVPSLAGRSTPSRQVVAYVEPPAQSRDAWARLPILIGLGEGEGFYTVPPVAGTAMKIGDHTFSLEGDPDTNREAGAEETRRVFRLARKRFRDFADWTLLHGKTCFYFVTSDEAFIIEQVDRAWIMSGFSGHGFKFGALMGEAVADGVEGRRTADELAHWAAGRE